jgi:hypothetical protein
MSDTPDRAKLLRETQISRFVTAESEAIDAELLVRQHELLIQMHPARAPEVQSWATHAAQDAKAKRERADAIREHASIQGGEYPTQLPFIRARLDNLARQHVEHEELANHADVYGVDADEMAFLAAQAKSSIDAIEEWIAAESARLTALGRDESGEPAETGDGEASTAS